MAALELFSTPLFLDANLQAYYRLEGNSNDAKNSNNGTDTSISYSVTNAKFGQAADFPSSNAGSYIAIPVSISATHDFTLHCWVYIPSTSQLGTFIKIGDASSGYAIGVGSGTMTSNGNNLIGLYEGVSWLDSATAIGTGLHMVDLVGDSSGHPKMYLDGVQVYSDTSNTPIAPANSAAIGRATGSNRYFNYGNIDDVALFNRALTAGEITSLYTGVFGGASNFFRMF